MSLLIKNVMLNGNRTDIAIEGNRIAKIAREINNTYDEVINASCYAAVPPFYNTHCHAAMTLLRGFADDMELFDWLNNHIWPAEEKLTAEDLYWGAKLACMEMIRSGTVFFNDMYFHPQVLIQAVEETGLRASIGLIALEANKETRKKFFKDNEEVLSKRASYSSRIQFSLAPHAIYSVSEQTLRKMAQDAVTMDLHVHTHLSETKTEVDDCFKTHGCSPVEYLERVGLLSERLLAAHSVHLSDSDIELYRKYNVTASYMPCSNYKLLSGRFRFHDLLQAGVRVTLGTDSCASNNNLSMFDEMKTGAFNAKAEYNSPTVCNAAQIYTAATKNGADAFGINAGVIEEGKLADIVLLDLNSTFLVADHNLISNLVYSADSSCVSTVICDGRVIMRDREIPGYIETVENARRCAKHLR